MPAIISAKPSSNGIRLPASENGVSVAEARWDHAIDHAGLTPRQLLNDIAARIDDRADAGGRGADYRNAFLGRA